MPRRLLLDGEDLSALMQRVRAEMGPDAVVVKAERVRVGGVAGFFAKEHFEVTVEVPDRPAARPRARPAAARPAPVGMAALLDAADAADLGGVPAPSPGTPSPTPGAPSASAPDARPTGAPRVSTDGDTFASLLASIDGMAGTQPPAPAVRPAAPRPEPAPSPSGGSPPEPAPEPEKPAIAPARFAPQGATVTAATFAPLESLDDVVPPARSAAPAVPSPARPGSRPVDLGEPHVPPTVVLPPARPATRPEGGGDRRALLDLGIPAAVLGAGPLDEPLPLSRLLAGLPRPPAPRREAGTVVVVVGEGSQALPVATGLAQRARLHAQDVVLAGAIDPVSGHGRRLLSPAAAARHRARVAPTDPVSIVALGVGPEADDWSAAAQLLAALAPDQSWAVVDARRKASDLRAWMHAIAGPRPFDVVAAAWVHETQEPGTVLDLGAPVGWLDGLPATPVVWAAVLSERLDVGAHWD